MSLTIDSDTVTIGAVKAKSSDKRAILDLFVKQITDAIAVLTQAALSAHEAATHSESKAEDQYDTRGLEASYLAGAQSRRAMELEEALTLFRHLDIKSFTESTPIASTALIELQDEDKLAVYFLLPLAGGMKAEHGGETIQTITPQSPLGTAILGHKVGEQVQIQLRGAIKDLDIVAVV